MQFLFSGAIYEFWVYIRYAIFLGKRYRQDLISNEISNSSTSLQLWQELSKQVGNNTGGSSGNCPSSKIALPSLQTWYSGSSWNPKIPEIHGTAHPKIALPAISSRNRPRFQDRFAFPEHRCCCFARSQRSLPRWAFRRHQSLRHPCKEGNDHAKGHPVGSPNSRGTCISSQNIKKRLSS